MNDARPLAHAPLPIVGRLLPAEARLWPWIIFTTALAVRVTWALYSHFRRTGLNELEFPDEEQYWLIANNLVEGLGLRDEIGHRAGRMPVVPFLMSLFVPLQHGIMWAKIVQWFVGSAVAVATFALGKRLFGAAAGIIAGFFLAFDPFFTFFSTLLLTEAPFALLLTAFYFILIPWIRRPERPVPIGEWLLATFLAIFLVYVRESTVGLLILVAAFVLIIHRFNRRIVVLGCLSLLLSVTAFFPWALRNKNVTGSWIWLTTRGGITLYDGVGPQANGQSYLNEVKQMPAVIGLTEVEYDQYFKTESRKCMREEPARMLSLAATKLSIFWNPFPNADYYNKPSTRMIASSWTIPTFSLAAVGIVLLWRLGSVHRRVLVFLLLPVLYLTTIHMVFVSSIRYRMGAIPMLYTIAAFALLFLVDKWRTRRAAE